MAFNVYFADRHFNIKGIASTEMSGALRIVADKEQSDIESGSISQEMTIAYTDPVLIKEIVKVGNYLLYQDSNGESHFLTIITTDNFASVSQIDLYAEDAGLDLLNETAKPYTADKAYPIAYYIEKFTYDTGFTVGINELGNSLNRKLEWTGESTFTERLLSVATQFDHAEIRYSFVVDGLKVTAKHVDIYKKRSRSLGATLALGRDVNEIKTSESIENLATAYWVTGGTPEGKDKPITLSGYKYDDGRFKVVGEQLQDYVSNTVWTRYLAPFETGTDQGYLVKTFSYDTTDQKELCNRAVSALKKASQVEQNFEVDIAVLPKDVQVGDMVNIVDYRGELYLEARVLSLETSRVEQTSTAVLGEYLIKDSGVSEQLKAMASQIAEAHKVVEQAKSFATVTELQAVQEVANNAKATADKASGDVQTAVDVADKASQDAQKALEAGEDAKQQLVPVLSDLQRLQELSVTQGQAIEDTKTAIQTKADELNADWQAQVDQYNTEIADIKKETDKIADIAAQGDTTAQTVDEQKQTITDLVTKTEGAVSKASQAEQTVTGFKQTVAEVSQSAEDSANKISQMTQTVEEMATTVANSASKTELKQTADQLVISVKEAKDYTDETLNKFGLFTAWCSSPETGADFTKVKPEASLPEGEEEDTVTTDGLLPYVGFCLKDSDDPKDYDWQLNPDYLDAVYQQAMSGKVDAADFLESLDGKVDNSEFDAVTGTLGELQDSYNDFVANKYESDLTSLESRAEGLVANLATKVATFNFLQDYIKLGDKGLVIGSSVSPLKMLLTKDTLAFVDGGKTVAYFSNQSFYINRGAIVESLTVGAHKLAKLDDDYTVLQWLGGAA